MILAGIDEAGYGPLLGPLVVGCSAFEVEGDPLAPLPCLWKRLRRHLSRNRLRSGRKIHVNDSKQVYSPSVGLKELERSVLTLAAAAGRHCDDLPSLLEHVAPHVLPELEQYPWYRPAEAERFPIEQSSQPLRLFANALRLEMERSQTRLIELRARVVLERQLNRLIKNTRNKASALFSVAAIHLDYLLRTYGQRGLVIFCDRQGGREHYGDLLRLMFEDWSLQIMHENDGHCEYRLRREAVTAGDGCAASTAGGGGGTVRLIFCEQAEEQCMSVAVASMLSKYLREALMRRFNAFWKSHLPEIDRTAGYYGDGGRFIREIDMKRRELAIEVEDLVRSR